MKNKLICLALAFLPCGLISQGFAPASIGGLLVQIQVISGSGDFETTGTFVYAFDADSNIVIEYAGPTVDWGGYVGIYGYSRTGANAATVTLTDPPTGLSYGVNFSFTSALTGTYAVANFLGTQNGTFRIYRSEASAPAPSGVWEWTEQWPFVWHSVAGWQYHHAAADGLWVYTFSARTWAKR